MTVLYSNDFEAVANGVAPAELPLLSGYQLLVQTTTSSVRGTKAIGRGSDGDASYWNGNTALTNTGMRSAQKLNAGIGTWYCHLHKTDTASIDRHIRFSIAYSAGNLRAQIEVRNSGLANSAFSTYSLAVVAGDILHIESLSIGTAHSMRIWKNSDIRPTSATVSLTDSLYASGAAGLRKIGVFEAAYVDDVVITDGAGGEDFFYPPAPTITTQPVAQTVANGATATFTVAATSATSYQWQHSIDAGVSFTNISGATATSYTTPATTQTGGSANNGDQYRVNATNTAGSVTSSAVLLTVNATATTITGPTVGSAGVASSNFTVGANGVITGTVRVTPSDSSGGGTFTPTYVDISAGTPTATFIYTAVSTGVKSITTTNNGALTPAAAWTYTVSAAVAFFGTVPAAAAITTAAFSLALSSYFVGGPSPYVYSLFSGTLPAGLALNTSTGIISGTPTTPGSASIVIRVTDNGTATANTNPFVITVTAAGTLTSGVLKRNGGTLVASATLTWLTLLNGTSGAFVATKASVAVNGSGIFTVVDAGMIAGTVYQATWLESTGPRGCGWVAAT